MYSLRSTRSKPLKESPTDLVQTTIAFRKRRRQGVERWKTINEDPTLPESLSPPKRNKQDITAASAITTAVMPVLRRTLRPRVERLSTPGKKKTCPQQKEKTSPVAQKTSPVAPQRSPLKDRNASSTSDENQATPTKTPSLAGRAVMKRLHFPDHSSLDEVKRALHNSLPSTLHCRESQLKTLNTYITTHLKKKTPGSIYISGPPGTGKTACLSHILSDSTNSDVFQQASIVNINCMSVKRPQAIYSTIASELIGAFKARSISALQDLLIDHITSTANMIIIILDEVDQLDCRGQEVLYSIFEWPALKHSKLLLIGIANALDLTDRILPRLQSHTTCQPTLLHFPPYTKDEIALILSSRLSGENTCTLIEPMAIQFTARKVAAIHGDVRKALDICRRATELVETEHLRIKPHPQENATPKPHLPIKVTLRHIAAVVSEIYSSTITVQSSQHTLPLQQKITVCVLLCLLRGHLKEVSVGKLHDAYVRVCRHRQLKYESESEFVGVCGMLESRGIIGLKKAKETRLMKVTLKLNEADLEYAIQDRVILSSILEHGIPPA